MARNSSTAPGVDRFRYTPGDGHVYVWQAGRTVITVYRIETTGKLRGRQEITFKATGDTIDVSDVSEPATATVMTARVAAWKTSRPSP